MPVPHTADDRRAHREPPSRPRPSLGALPGRGLPGRGLPGRGLPGRGLPGRPWLVGALLILLLGVGAVVRTSFASAASGQLPVTVANHSGRAEATYLYVIARDGRTGRAGYVDAAGTWHAWDFPASVAPGRPNPPAPDVSVPGPGNGASRQLMLPPDLAGGRIYLSMGQKLQFFMTPQGLVEPAPWAAGDVSRDVLYDWTEFARTGNRIFINTTTVDMFSLPLSVTVRGASTGVRTEGGLVGDRAAVFRAIDGLGGDWSKLISRRPSDGLPVRVLAPAHAVRAGMLGTSAFDRYVDEVWAYYATHTLTVAMQSGTFRGTVSGRGFTFRDAAGAVIGTLPKPSAADVLGCAGSLQPSGQPNQTAILAVGARVCAGLHRATLSTSGRVMSDVQPTTDPKTFYGGPGADLYSKVMHDQAKTGRAYGFAYDDVADFAPTIDEPDPVSVTMTIGAFDAAATPTPSAPGSAVPVAGQQVVGPGGLCVDPAGDDVGGDGVPVRLEVCRATARDQHWTWEGTSLRTLGWCLDVAGGATGNRTGLQLHDCTGHPAQQWVVHGNGLRNPVSGRCLDSPGGSTTVGTRLQIYDCNGTAAQRFRAGGR